MNYTNLQGDWWTASVISPPKSTEEAVAAATGAAAADSTKFDFKYFVANYHIAS